MSIDDAVALHRAALSTQDDHRYSETVRLCRRALDLFEAHAGTGADIANVASLLGAALDELDRHEEALACHERAVAELTPLPHETGVGLRLLVQAQRGLAGNARRRGRYDEAERLLLDVLALASSSSSEFDELAVASIRNELGILYKYAGRFDEAEAYYTRAKAAIEAELGPDAPRLAGIYHNLAGLAHSRGRAAEGEIHARRSLELHHRAYPAGHPAIVADGAHLAALLEAQGKYAEAEPLLRRAVEFFTERYGPDHYDVVVNLHNLAAVRAGQGFLAEAEELYERALDGKRRQLGADHPEVALTLNNLAVVAGDRGDPARAATLADEAYRVLAAVVGDDHPALRAAAANQAYFSGLADLTAVAEGVT